MKRAVFIALMLIASSCTSASKPVVTIGAVYPLGGSQGSLGTDEYRGVLLAAERANATGGVHGARIDVRISQADDAEHAPAAVAKLAEAGIAAVLGSHGSLIARPAAFASARRGMVFWETGAIGPLDMDGANGARIFRFAPTGATLGREAVRFARGQLLPKLHRVASKLRYGVVYVDDGYGSSVGRGALDEIARAHLTLAGSWHYTVRGVRYASLARQIKAAHTDVLFVSAYIDDGVALRRELVTQRVPLVASVGTSSSYCMPEFGARLGAAAVGLYASDKPDGDIVDPRALRPEAASELLWARATFKARWGHPMPAGALTGFSGAWALFHDVLPRAKTLTPDGIASAARAVSAPLGSYANGSGLEFGPSGGENLRATSVIWEWIKPRTRAVVWPPAFATSPIVPVSI